MKGFELDFELDWLFIFFEFDNDKDVSKIVLSKFRRVWIDGEKRNKVTNEPYHTPISSIIEIYFVMRIVARLIS